jgi:hypothetical protein
MCVCVSVSRAEFLQRQALYGDAAKQHAAERRQAEEEAAANLFKPQIHSTTENILRDARPELLLEGPEERARRMSEDEQKRIKARKHQLEKSIYNSEEYTFAPAIDSVSKALGRDSSIDELYENRRGQRIKMNLIRKANEDIAKECSFTPQTNHKRDAYAADVSLVGARAVPVWESCHGAQEDELARRQLLRMAPNDASRRPSSASGVRINLREPERMARDIKYYLAEKEEKRREILAAREINELSECTFEPAVPEFKPTVFKAPVVVRGIARHLELKNLSDKLRKEKADREKNAFKVKNIEKIKRTGDGNTIVEVNFTSVLCQFLMMHVCD